VTLRILLVEDNENNRYLARYLLERAGFEVEAAEDGVRALTLARRGGHDLVVLDIQMPEMDGYETARALRGDPALAAVPIVGVSSFVMSGEREKALRLGFAGYIEKPIDPETFAAEIRSFLPGRGSGP
jgi:two-component system, cell cycle response regulator DivK